MAIVSSDLLTAMNGTSSSSSTTTSSSSLDNNSPDAIQNRFLTLLIAQMKNQDPSNPMDNSQLTTQMAQLSTVTGISQLNNSLSTLMSNLNSSQALSTANMIGHSVLAPGNSIQLTSDTTKDASGTETTSQKAVFGVNLSGTASSVVVTIKDSSGAVVHTTDLGTQAAGVVPVIWDGSNDTGGKVADGNHRFDPVVRYRFQRLDCVGRRQAQRHQCRHHQADRRRANSLIVITDNIRNKGISHEFSARSERTERRSQEPGRHR
jgi:flagellar basal-body rod modification protein FlgD